MVMINGAPSVIGYMASDASWHMAQQGLTGQDFHERARIARYVREVHEGTCEHHVDKALKSRYHVDTYAALKIQSGIQTHNRLLSDVLGKVCVGFENGATYALVGTDGEPVESVEFDSLMGVARYNELLRALDVLTELHPRVAVMPAVHMNPDTGTRYFHHVVLTPESFNAITAEHDPTKLIQFDVYCEEVRDGKVVQCKHSWTALEFVKYSMGRGSKWVEEERVDNPYGRINVVLFGRNAPVTSLWCDVPGKMLADKQVEANCWETMLSYQGSGQIKVLAGEFKGFPQGQALRHAGVIDVGNAENIGLLDFQTDVAGFVTTFISRLRKEAAVALGLSGDEFDASTQPPSGESLKMKYWARDRYALQKRGFLVSALKDLYALTLVVLDVQLRVAGEGAIDDVGALPPEGNFVVDVHEISYPELMTEAQTRTDWELQKGLTSLIIQAQRANPDLTREQAETFVRTNLYDNARLSRAPPPVNTVPLSQRIAAASAQREGK